MDIVIGEEKKGFWLSPITTRLLLDHYWQYYLAISLAYPGHVGKIDEINTALFSI